MLEDGLYMLEKNLGTRPRWTSWPGSSRASMKGWDYAAAHPDEAVNIVLKNDTTGAQTRQHQTTQVQEIAKLLGGAKGTGYLDPADYERTVKILTENKVLTKEPKGAWTHKVYDASAKP